MTTTEATTSRASASETPFERRVGHPLGLFLLFFAEMWERFSYYGMRALLVFYMMKGFLGFGDSKAYAVYGAYTALVYATPFIGGLLADKLLGARRAVVIGGLLMAAGHLLMTLEVDAAFYGALALLICGNGFFKPNISTIVGGLYPDRPEKRDSGFTIFYMGINLGAAMAPLLCGYIGETYGWHYGFGLATIGMLIGLAVFVAPARVTQVLIGLGALAAAGLMVYSVRENPLLLAINLAIAIALLVAAGFATWALSHGALPDEAGRAPSEEALKAPFVAGLSKLQTVYLGIVVAVPVLALLVRRDELAGYLLTVFGIIALVVIVREAIRGTLVERQRLFVVLVMMFFSMLFWAFFEQAGSSVNNFTDRNVDRVFEDRVITTADVGTTLDLVPTQAMLGYVAPAGTISGHDGKVITLDKLEALKTSVAGGTVSWLVDASHVGMGLGASSSAEIPASTFQSANPIFILLFGLVFSALWAFLAKRKLEPSTPVKFGLGLLQLGLGFAAFWYGAKTASSNGMVGVSWLLLGYLLHTTGELCISPVGLSMVTKLSPPRIVSRVMGAWFLATAFSNLLAAVIAQLTGVGGHGGEEAVGVPPPVETVGVYGAVFGQIAVAAAVSALLVFALSPLLRRWMHEDAPMG
ncbi:MAG: peptide MFS transporter, partial [Myxococcota bacterium]